MQVGIGIGAGFGGLGAARKTYARVVFVGASIMQQTFGQNLATPNATRTTAFRAAGLAVDVYGYGWSGTVISSIRPRVLEALAAFPADTLFVIHIGGNNVSNTRPYATSTTAERNAIIADYNGLIADIGARKGDVILCPITFRTYEDEADILALPAPRNAVFADEALGSKPYNDAIFIPAIAAWRPEIMNSDGNPVVDLYNATRNVYETYVSGDGVHPENPGGRDVLAQIFIDRLGHFINATPKPAPIVPRSVAPVAPANTGAPTITGTAQEGQVLSASTGTWSGTAPITYAYQWRRGGVAIAGATASTYPLAGADVGSTITVTVTATNSAGSASVTSAATATVAAAGSAPANTVLPAITGTAQEGQTLSASTGTWTGTPAPTYGYQWRRAGTAISGAVGATYALVAADVGAAITVAVTASNASGSASAVSAATATVTAAGGGSPLIVKFGSADADAGFNGSRVLAADVRSALNPSKPAILLKYADGTNSPFSLLVEHPAAAIGNNTYNNNLNGGRATGVAAFDGTLFNDFIYSDSLFADMNSGPLTLTLSGLTPGASYSLSFGASRTATGTRITRVTDGVVTISYDATLTPPPVPVTGVFAASAAGVIVLTVSNPAGTALNTWAYLGGMRVV